ncbi:hypothetical protein, partial [Pseudomonas fulva]
ETAGPMDKGSCKASQFCRLISISIFRSNMRASGELNGAGVFEGIGQVAGFARVILHGSLPNGIASRFFASSTE